MNTLTDLFSKELSGLMFIDIETVPLVSDFNLLSERMQEHWIKKAHRVMPNEDFEIEDSWQTKAGIYAEFAKVVCISVGRFFLDEEGECRFKVKSFMNEEESVLLHEFSEMLHLIKKKDFRFVGHNIKEFDLPFLCRRMLVQQVAIPKCLQLSSFKPWSNPNIDTMELWKFGDYKSFTSLDLLATIFDIPTSKDDIDGTKVAEVYYKERNLDRITQYCAKDVVLTAKVFLRLKCFPPLFDEEIVIL
ncbi:3'-5' exonuclease [Sediminitomix flava]|uniref:Predicted 3'-5' exonuclease PolB-like domain-containing protein n=1 Tax=Sediminitomix flava TaxID=379075 RepID=A0A315ZWH7_SEDFL|nr:3'-5' exonuclease [Sediminitomix flava]PWJ41043.1 hypothetical protein BC781_104318 [Sediminitomix flava]